MARRRAKCKYGRVKSGPRKGRCRMRKVTSARSKVAWYRPYPNAKPRRKRRNPCKGETGVFYRQCMQRTSMARARRLLG